jgi:hypothetical protein
VTRLHAGFWIGFSLAIAAVLSLAVVAARSGSGAATRHRAVPALRAHGKHVVRPTRGPLADTLAVFARPRTKEDAPPSRVAATLTDLEGQEQVSPALRPGTPSLHSSRQLLADVGSWHGSIYAAPTERGNVCYLVTGGPETCPARFSQASPVDVMVFDRDEVGRGSPAAVAGLVPNDVAGITVVVDGVGHPARIDDNAYFYELEDATASSPESLLVRYRDGTSLTMQLPSLDG